MSRHAPGLAQEQARRVVQHLLGGGELRTMAMVVAMLVGVGWFADSLYGWLEDIGNALEGRPVDDWFPLYRVIAVTAFVGGFLHLYRLARAAREGYRPTVRSEIQPAQVTGLVLYLSPLKSDVDKLREALPVIEDIRAFRDRFGNMNWRMPLEAIDYHQPRLSHVILICSAGEDGSARQAALFRELAGRLFPQTGLTLIDGIDFDDVDALAEATNGAYTDLTQQGLRTWDILIDITGGHKTTAIAGTAVALAEGRRIQYVNQNYKVCVFDVTYEQ